MAPKKKQQTQSTKKAPQKSAKNPSSSSSSGPKLQISAENEQRLRRLLLNNSSARPSPSPAPVASENLSKSQKVKRLRTVYEKLSCEGFTSDQIERALKALNEGATFESALDWLCLNLPGNELPLKFSSGASITNEGGSISIISTARENWVPAPQSPSKDEEEKLGVAVKIKVREVDDTLDLQQPSQADWIRQYMEQQEEEEWEALTSGANDEGSKEVSDPCSRVEAIAKEYRAARLEAVDAKAKKDKKRQEQAGKTIRKLKQEISALGLSDDIFASDVVDERASDCVTKDTIGDSQICKDPETDYTNIGTIGNFGTDEIEPVRDVNATGCCSSNVSDGVCDPPISSSHGSSTVESEEPDIELNDLFSEDASSGVTLPPKKEKMAQLPRGHILEKIEGFWKKGDSRKIPKAILHQLCQRLGWEAPKFTKIPGLEDGFNYSISIVRKASGRGKSRQAGGLITIQLPLQDEGYDSVEDAQNRVAAFALYQLFPEVPVHQLITEPYSSFIMNWQEGESTTRIEDSEETRRATFVDALLTAGTSGSSTSIKHSSSEKFAEPQVRESVESTYSNAKLKRINHSKDVESVRLRREQENKMGVQKYKEMLEARAALPITEVKDDILGALKENDVVVVCGETGSGKTTQVPQFILDDMIEAGKGGYCNIVCTQPRRIAAISVAERVSDERCEPPPGSDGSLVGFQVRLDSARTERTKLLFCTTGILLRKLAGDKNLADVTHVIVDEVHERSLLGDFLLVVLKNLLEKQSNNALNTRKLKVILMSATVDPSLFSKYFGNCPVITAQGRTHPVSTYFLEDIYESLKYALASDSPASLRNISSSQEKFQKNTVDNHRGKKNLVLSGWGDDAILSETYTNPNYDPSSYGSYTERTRENLKSLNEDVIDYDLLEDLVCHVDETCPAGAILIFLPGVAEIYMLLDRLVASYRFGPNSDWLLPLHSSLASDDQRKAFLSPPENIRKVIVATDVAETSITINDVVYVIDSGKHKENRYNPQKKLSSMVEDWISRANAKQRRGRAGRVKPGTCFCLYTHNRFDNLMRPFQVPEMLRMPLIELCLQIKLLSLGYIKQFLMKAIEPPREEAMASALSVLYEVGAVEGDEELTPLGYHLAKLPVDVLIGKMMIYGGMFNCLSPILSISACLSYKSPFVYSQDERQNVNQAKHFLLTEKLDGVSYSSVGSSQSDHMVMVVAYSKWSKILHEKGAKAAQNFCSSYFLSSSVMYMIRDMRIQFGSLLGDIGLVNLPKTFQTWKMKDKLDRWFADMSQPFNRYSHHSSVVKSILCAGLYPNVAATEDGVAVSSNINPFPSSARKGRPFWYDGRREVYIHPSSINSSLHPFQYPFLVYLEKVETNKIFLRDTSMVSPYSILLFGGSINVQHQTGLVTIDGWLKLAAPAQTAVLFKELRLTLHSVLKELIRKPELATTENEIIRSIVHLLLEEEKPQL